MHLIYSSIYQLIWNCARALPFVSGIWFVISKLLFSLGYGQAVYYQVRYRTMILCYFYNSYDGELGAGKLQFEKNNKIYNISCSWATVITSAYSLSLLSSLTNAKTSNIHSGLYMKWWVAPEKMYSPFEMYCFYINLVA